MMPLYNNLAWLLGECAADLGSCLHTKWSRALNKEAPQEVRSFNV